MPIKNRQYTVKIDALNAEGEGIGRVDGFAVFVKNALPGETVEILVIKVKKNYGYGKLLSIITPSTARVQPVCPVFSQCGGCSLQHMNYEAQLVYKTGKVSDALKHIGGLDCAVLPAIGMQSPFGCRNKAQYPIRALDGKPAIGFYAKRSHRLVPVKECLMQAAVNTRILTIIESFMIKNQIKPYDEETHTGVFRHVLTRIGFKTGEIMVVLIINGDNLPHAVELVEELRQIENMTSIVLNINIKRTNVILGGRTEALWPNSGCQGRSFITDYIGPIKFRISPQSFFQVNPVQTKILYETAVLFAQLTPRDIVIDAYCGIGSISLFMAGMVEKVYGIEIIPEAIADANINAEINNITNTEFICGEVETVLPELISGSIHPDVIFLDPPRKGCDPRVLNAVVQSAIDRLIYISCDPATMARDVKILTAGGYTVERVQPVDFFPMTPHVETVVKLSFRAVH